MEIMSYAYSSNLYNKTNINRQNRYNYPSFKGASADVFVKGAETVGAMFDINASKKLISIFDRKLTKLPKGLNLTVSQATDSILSYSKEVGDGIVLKGTKMAVERKKQRFFYAVFKELKNGVPKDTFAIDMESGELIKLRSDGTLRLIKGDVIKYDEKSTDAKHIKHCKKIRLYAAAVFGEKPPEISTEPVKKATKMRVTKSDAGKDNWIIEKSPYSDLPENLQQDVADIDETILKFSALIDAHRGKSKDIVGFKQEYEPVIYTTSKDKRHTFKYKNLEELAVLHIPSNARFTRIIHTNSIGDETHLLIDSRQKVVSNLNQKRPQLIPEKYRYMNQEQIEASGIAGYIKFIKEEMHKYYDYMAGKLGSTEVKHRIRVKTSQNTLSKYLDDITTKISTNLDEMHGEIEKRADSDAQELVQRYFNTLAQSFETYSKENLKGFMKKFEDFLNRFISEKQ